MDPTQAPPDETPPDPAPGAPGAAPAAGPTGGSGAAAVLPAAIATPGAAPGASGAPPAPATAFAAAEATAAVAYDAPSPQRGLVAWIIVIGLGSLLCALLGHPELSLLFAGAGVFALAQATDAAAATDRYRRWVSDSFREGSIAGDLFRLLVALIVPGMGALAYLGIGTYAWRLGDEPFHRFAAVWSFAAALVGLLLVARPVADRLTALLFRTGPVGRTRRLAARLFVLGILLPVPMQALLPDLLDAMRDSPVPLADAGALVAQLLGEIAIALAGVGWLVRRRWPATRERLGLGGVRLAHAGVVLAGLVAAIALNAGMEALQRTALPGLWRHDQEVTKLIAGQMPVWTALLLGLSAGFGEELLLRGALQPRLGVVLTAVLFASGHVQYSWFGMVTIALLGMLLGLVRKRTNTTTAILVHMLYDVFAVVGSQG